MEERVQARKVRHSRYWDRGEGTVISLPYWDAQMVRHVTVMWDDSGAMERVRESELEVISHAVD